MDDRIHLRIFEDQGVDSFQFDPESDDQLRRDVTEPTDCFRQICVSLEGDEELAFHLVPNSSSLISRQGRAEDGFS